MTDIGSLEQKERFEELMELVSSYRKKKVLACKNEKDRCRALAAGLLLRYALQKHGLEEKEVQYQENANGKLLLANHLDIYFNLSHAGNYAVCGIASENVGVDLESVTERFSGEKGERRLLSLIRKTLTEEERGLFEGLDQKDKILLFSRIWTKKESFAKEDGRGMLIPFSEIDTIKAVYSVDMEIKSGYWLSVYQKHPEEADFFYLDFSKKGCNVIEMESSFYA